MILFINWFLADPPFWWVGFFVSETVHDSGQKTPPHHNPTGVIGCLDHGPLHTTCTDFLWKLSKNFFGKIFAIFLAQYLENTYLCSIKTKPQKL